MGKKEKVEKVKERWGFYINNWNISQKSSKIVLIKKSEKCNFFYYEHGPVNKTF